ncbi:Sjogren's syndrome/scleroderma autoantigen 1 family protein [Halocatena salina]|uniref:Sjogren's syndrome/scleroderma autoantigen 1 (Autoantigen p27) n=1 Tax=Halocatena salina TaxID=2934340 RepID=A0A8U0A3P6_9EURY|nr:Sjogren's syndrome/scleroderma autoantigen 1 family protein [Halocatena salina]UPM43821.1 hypothetical protein MW046_05090 [Halocatena salina]
MSEFDEDAEREKLRKQFEQDKRKRESTERMSELLLQGATMTDTHCDTCSDPLFRYEGQEFCPTCQVRTDEQRSGDTPRSATDTQQATADAESSEPPETTASTQIEIEDETAPSEDHTEPTTDTTTTDTSATAADVPSDPDLSTARQSLVTTITRFAKHAETTEDPDRARKFLAATEDAATALDALNQASK